MEAKPIDKLKKHLLICSDEWLTDQLDVLAKAKFSDDYKKSYGYQDFINTIKQEIRKRKLNQIKYL